MKIMWLREHIERWLYIIAGFTIADCLFLCWFSHFYNFPRHFCSPSTELDNRKTQWEKDPDNCSSIKSILSIGHCMNWLATWLGHVPMQIENETNNNYRDIESYTFGLIRVEWAKSNRSQAYAYYIDCCETDWYGGICCNSESYISNGVAVASHTQFNNSQPHLQSSWSLSKFACALCERVWLVLINDFIIDRQPQRLRYMQVTRFVHMSNITSAILIEIYFCIEFENWASSNWEEASDHVLWHTTTSDEQQQ